MTLRVALVVNRLDYGGTERIIDRLCRSLDPGLVQVVPIAVRGLGHLGDALQKDGFGVHDLKVSGGLKQQPLRSVYAMQKLATFLIKQHIDLIHGFLFEGNLVARLAARRAHIPALSSFRGDHFGLPFERWVEQGSQHLVRRYVAVSQATAQAAKQKLGLSQRHIDVIHNGIILPEHVQPAHQLKTLAYLGRLHDEKGVNILLQAFAQMAKPRPELRLAGDGPEQSKLKKLAAQLHIDDEIDFLGRVDPDKDFWKKVDALVVPSRHEGLSNVALEAMAHARAVIATDVGGNRELVDNTKTGFIVPRDDVKSLANAMQKLKQPGLLAQFGQAGRERVEQHFSQQKMLAAYLKLWREVVA